MAHLSEGRLCDAIKGPLVVALECVLACQWHAVLRAGSNDLVQQACTQPGGSDSWRGNSEAALPLPVLFAAGEVLAKRRTESKAVQQCSLSAEASWPSCRAH